MLNTKSLKEGDYVLLTENYYYRLPMLVTFADESNVFLKEESLLSGPFRIFRITKATGKLHVYTETGWDLIKDPELEKKDMSECYSDLYERRSELWA